MNDAATVRGSEIISLILVRIYNWGGRSAHCYIGVMQFVTARSNLYLLGVFFQELTAPDLLPRHVLIKSSRHASLSYS